MVRRLTIVLVVLGVMLSAGAASAHDPLFLTSDQTTPESGPLLPDGTISFAIYGDLAGDGDTRGLQVVFDEGDRLLVEVLIPALSPEADLADDQLPVATVVAPDGSETTLVPILRGLQHAGFEVRVCALDIREGNPVEPILRGHGIPVDLVQIRKLRDLPGLIRLSRYAPARALAQWQSLDADALDSAQHEQLRAAIALRDEVLVSRPGRVLHRQVEPEGSHA